MRSAVDASILLAFHAGTRQAIVAKRIVSDLGSEMAPPIPSSVVETAEGAAFIRAQMAEQPGCRTAKTLRSFRDRDRAQ